MPALSIIIVSYHTGSILFDALERALGSAGAEVIVVNNGNPPETTIKLEQLAEQSELRLIQGQGNVGFSKACNLGANAATAETLLFLNPDALIGKTIDGENSALALLACHQALPGDCLLSGLVLDPNGQPQRGCIRNALTPQSLLVEMSLLYKFIPALRRYRFNLEQYPLPFQLAEVGAISGACMMISRSFLNRLGGLDEGYFLHFEDVDLCHRVWQSGGKVMFYGAARFEHAKSSSDVASEVIAEHKLKSFSRYFQQHFPKTWQSPLGWLFKGVFWLTLKRRSLANNKGA